MSLLNFSPFKKAIAYYRHSAEDKQENSVAIQRDHAQKFARENNMEIIHEEADEGKSGLSAERAGFQKILLNWVFNDNAPAFDYILVYDVSRWGRFQNPDEAAMYQYQCTKRGKKIIFVDKGIPREDQALINHLQTSIERYMAADYSRQLSGKVFFGSAKVSEQGYSAGGVACYGMARLLLDANKQPIRTLKLGEHKQISNERVIFTPLNDATTQTVQDIFDLCANQSKTPDDIALILNQRNIPAPNGGLWDKYKIVRILSNETYVGSRIYNKTWKRLKQKGRRNPRSEWVICPNAFEAVVSKDVFEKAQQFLQHLFPIRPKGISFIAKKLRQTIRKDLSSLLSSRGVDEDKISIMLRSFPVVFSTKFFRTDVPNWCFSVTEKMRNYESVLAVSIDLNKEDYIDDVFCIPTDQFWLSNFLIFSQQDTQYSEFLISGKVIEEKVQMILDDVDSGLSSIELSTVE
jgi:DNA invertase Pin-like site-specific DNA recombinase